MDPSGSILQGAQVTVSQPATGRSRTVETNEFGDYLVPFRPSGDYRVSARYEGLQLVEREGIRLLVNQRARVDIVLPAGDVSFSVIVTEDAPLIEMDSSSLGAVIDDHKVKELPLNGRDFFELTYIVAGAVPGAEESQNSTQGGAVAVNGMREQSNNFLLDGVDNNNQFLNQLTVPPPVEAVQEFKIQSGVYGAEFGSRAGAQLNVVTRSGTNQFRATLYNFHRNAALDTRNFFGSFRPRHSALRSESVWNGWRGSYRPRQDLLFRHLRRTERNQRNHAFGDRPAVRVH